MSIDTKDEMKMTTALKKTDARRSTLRRSAADRKSRALNVKASASERQLIEDAAYQERLELSSYIRRSLVKQAEIDLSLRREFIVSDEVMDEFIEILNRPVKEKPNLKKLLTEDVLIND